MLKVSPYEIFYETGFIVDGHADYATHGYDIVCSAISALSQTTAMALEKVSEINSSIRPGYMEIHVPLPNTYTRILIDSMMNGIRAIAKKYPKYVMIIEESDYE